MRALLLMALTATLAACGGDDGDDDARSASPLQTDAEVRLSVDADGVSTPLTELNESGQTGEVTLTPAGEATLVVVRIDKPGADELSVALHRGSCVELGDVVQELEPVGERPAETTVDQRLDGLLAEPHAVTVGEGPDACADVAGPGD